MSYFYQKTFASARALCWLQSCQKTAFSISRLEGVEGEQTWL